MVRSQPLPLLHRYTLHRLVAYLFLEMFISGADLHVCIDSLGS
jgi:hypothetical protein